jgi:putative selenium metabolism protein SsnA
MIIHNGKIVTWEEENRLLSDHALYIKADSIIEIAESKKLLEKYPEEERVNANGMLVMPGNICAHTHFYGAFARGMAIPGSPAKDFPDILQKLWWPLDQALSYEDVHFSALVCLIDAIKHGTTTLIDHHASPNSIDGSLDQIAEAVLKSGLRASLCYEVTDRGGIDKAKAGIRENVRFINRLKANPHPFLAASFGLHASLTLSDSTLELCQKAMQFDTGFHIHIAEHEVDEYDSLEKSQRRVVDRLQRFGILGPKSIAVHAVHIDPKEVQILADTKTWVTHQPRSNMNNGVGLGNVEGFMRAGVKVCLGNDGFSNAMWEEWKAAYLAHKLWNRDPRRMGGYEVVRMAITNNQALAGQFFPGKKIGQICPGAVADIIFVDYHPFTELTAGNLPWHILFGFHESMIDSTIVGGKILMQNRKLKFLDEAEITQQARELSMQTWQRYRQQFNS